MINRLKKYGLLLLSFCCLKVAAEFKENQVFSIRLKQAPMVASLQELALVQGTNLVVDDELEGSLSLQLDNVDLDRVLRSVARMKGLSLRVEDDIYYLGKRSEQEAFAAPMNAVPSALVGESVDALKESESNLVSRTIKLHLAARCYRRRVRLPLMIVVTY